jgi:four helix bundle protein
LKNDNVIQEKSFAFALRTVNLYKYLREKKKEYVLAKQLLRSGTSIGANIEEAIGGQSGKDFISKLSIAYKEARETIYWLKLLQAASFLSAEQASSILVMDKKSAKFLVKFK